MISIISEIKFNEIGHYCDGRITTIHGDIFEIIKVKKNHSTILSEKLNNILKRGNNNELVHK